MCVTEFNVDIIICNASLVVEVSFDGLFLEYYSCDDFGGAMVMRRGVCERQYWALYLYNG